MHSITVALFKTLPVRHWFTGKDWKILGKNFVLVVKIQTGKKYHVTKDLLKATFSFIKIQFL